MLTLDYGRVYDWHAIGFGHGLDEEYANYAEACGDGRGTGVRIAPYWPPPDLTEAVC